MAAGWKPVRGEVYRAILQRAAPNEPLGRRRSAGSVGARTSRPRPEPRGLLGEQGKRREGPTVRLRAATIFPGRCPSPWSHHAKRTLLPARFRVLGDPFLRAGEPSLPRRPAGGRAPGTPPGPLARPERRRAHGLRDAAAERFHDPVQHLPERRAGRARGLGSAVRRGGLPQDLAHGILRRGHGWPRRPGVDREVGPPEAPSSPAS